MPVTPGARLGPYEIVAPLGAGGMGEVFKARDTRLGRVVAIKVLPAGLAADPERRRRFEQEARAVAALSHQHICVLHDIGSQGGVDFLVMEYLDGETLAARLRPSTRARGFGEASPRSPLRLKDALEIGAQVADALGAAHRRGIVHRDLKPANIMLTTGAGRSGGLHAKLLDFGLAKLRQDRDGGAAGASALTTEAPLSGDHQLLGTVPYMAPEQLEGKPVDARTDVFALGCVLYEMLTGRRAFEGSSSATVMAAILTSEPPSVSTLQPVTPPILDRLVRTCLAKRPDDRWDSAHDVAEQLRAISDASGPTQVAATGPVAAPARRWTRRRTALVGLATLVIVVAGVVAVQLWQRTTAVPARPLDPKTVAVAIFENRTGDRELDRLGKSLAESIADGLAPVEAVKVVPTATVFQIAASAEASGGVSDWVRRLGRMIGAARVNSDPVRALAEATGAGLIVSGSYDVQGQTLWLRTTLTDVIANKPFYTLSPIEVLREKAIEAVKIAQQQVLDTVAARYFNPWQNLLLEEMRPPRFEAQREYLAGFERIPVDSEAAARHFNSALKLDADFVGPHFGLVGVANYRGLWDEQAARTASLEKLVGRMTPLAKRRLAGAKVNITDPAQMDEALTAQRDIVRLSPESVADAMGLGMTALNCNYPAEAADALTKKGMRWDLIAGSSNPNGPQFFMSLTAALHLLSRHAEELEHARAGGRTYAGSLSLRAFEARALAALGRLDDLDRLVQGLLTMAPQTFEHYFLRRGTPGYVMLAAAEELRTHGHRDASLTMANRAVDWYRSRVGDEEKSEATRAGLGDALYQAERWQEAKAVFAELAKPPEPYDQDIYYQGRLATLAARLGDAAGARRMAEALRRRTDRWQDGKHTFRAARVVGLLGDKDGAVRLLKEAIAQGAGISEIPDAYGYGFIFSHCMDLESLRGYPPFEELIKPKG